MCLEIKREEFREFFDTERTESHGDELKKTVSKFPVRIIHLSQCPRICFIECLR
jgi:hypothetical protein